MRANDGRPFARVRPRVRSINPSIARIDARAHPSIARIDRAMRAHRSRASGDSTAWSRFADAMFYVWGSRTAGPTDRRTRGRRFWRERARARVLTQRWRYVCVRASSILCAQAVRARFAVRGRWMCGCASIGAMDVEDRCVHQCAPRACAPRRRVAWCARTAEYAPSRAIVVASDARHRWIASLDRSLARSLAKIFSCARTVGRRRCSDVRTSFRRRRLAVRCRRRTTTTKGRRRTNGGAPRVDETRAMRRRIATHHPPPP